LVRERIIQEYTSGLKTATMLGEEYGRSTQTIRGMVYEYKKRNRANFAGVITQPIMPRTKKKTILRLGSATTDDSTLQAENERLKRHLQLAQLKIEGYQIMGNILEEEYGIDLLKKVEAGQCHVLKKDTQKSACNASANCSATAGKPITKA
jgi:hypothetical protein